MTPARVALLAARMVAAAVVVRNLARAAHREQPVVPAATATPSISVVVPARAEAARIGPHLAPRGGAPRRDEVGVGVVL
jgi:hypothetical protein